MKIINILKGRDIFATFGRIKFGKTYKSDKPTVECPKCKSIINIYNGLTKEYKCSRCGHIWENK